MAKLASKRLGKRHPLNMRTTKLLRRKLEQEAREAGRSLAAEIEIRLEKSMLYTDYEAGFRAGQRHK